MFNFLSELLVRSYCCLVKVKSLKVSRECINIAVIQYQPEPVLYYGP